MTTILISVLVVAPFAIYFVAMLKASRDKNDPDGFFLARGRISSLEFANTSVAYGFQIASVSIFFAWGYHFGLGAFVNPVFWGLGILFFVVILPRLSPFFGTAQTLHGFLGRRYRSRSLTVAASVMTLLGFLGAFTAELVWGSAILRVISGNPLFITVATTAMGVFVLLYVIRAGQVSVVKTDQYQLIFAHASFVLLLIVLTTMLHWRGDTAKAVGLLLSVVTLVILAIVSLSIYRQLTFERTNCSGSPATRTILAVMGLGTLAALVNTILFLQTTSLTSLSALGGEQNLYSLELGSVNLLSLALLPLFWHFADVTMWQRLGSIRRNQEEGTAKVEQRIRRGLYRYALESPASWILAILAGIAIRYADIGITGDTVYDGIASIPLALISATTPLGTVGGALIAGVFGAGIIAAMLSTADSFMIGSMFTFVYDIWPTVTGKKSGDVVHQYPMQAIRFGVAAATAMMVVGLGSFWLATAFNFDIISLLFGALGAQVSLFPSVFGTLVLGERAPSGRWAFLSIVAGFAGAVFSTMVALRDPSWALYGPLWSLGLSIPVYAVGALLHARKTRPDTIGGSTR